MKHCKKTTDLTILYECDVLSTAGVPQNVVLQVEDRSQALPPLSTTRAHFHPPETNVWCRTELEILNNLWGLGTE
jgi:hypothetical protein